MDGNCNVESIIYPAEDTSQTTKETYIGLCDTSSKLAYRNHTSSFCNEWYKNANKLSKHMWNLKDQNIQYNIKWRKIKHARSYSNVTKKCNLCLWEKYFILCKLEMSSLNNRNELTSCCRDSRKFLLKNVTTYLFTSRQAHHAPHPVCLVFKFSYTRSPWVLAYTIHLKCPSPKILYFLI